MRRPLTAVGFALMELYQGDKNYDFNVVTKPSEWLFSLDIILVTAGLVKYDNDNTILEEYEKN